MSAIDIAAILRLRVDERIRLAQAIWDTLAEEMEPLPLTEAEIAEIERRLDAHRRDPSRARPADEVLARLERDFG